MLSYAEHGKFRAQTQVSQRNKRRFAGFPAAGPPPSPALVVPRVQWITGLAGAQWSAYACTANSEQNPNQLQ